jgi:hypothetical protein
VSRILLGESQSFYRNREGMGRVAEAVGVAERAWVQFVAAEEGEGRTRLCITASTADLERNLERWVTTELRATPCSD